MKKSIAIFLCLCLALSLAACGASSKPQDLKTESYSGGMAINGIYDSADMALPEEPAAGGTEEAGSAGMQNQKLIRTMYLETETEDLDALMAQLSAKVSALGGYLENKSVHNGSTYANRRYRNASMVIRVPVDKMDAFVSQVADASNVVEQTEESEDITLTYVATQSRITALETEQTRLLELLAGAENMTDLLQIEQRLTDVRTELEQVTSQLRLYDNKIDYGTIHLAITEVQEYTPVEEETLWQRMASGLKESWKALGEFGEGLLVVLASALPWLIPVAIAGGIAVLVVKLAYKKKPRK